MRFAKPCPAISVIRETWFNLFYSILLKIIAAWRFGVTVT